jgi:uncharacterized 2Fe-2S/4Fe-4S cluster protein (DUF4445 family)
MLVHITSEGNRCTVQAAEGACVASLAAVAGYPLNQSCGGKGICGTCTVRLGHGRYIISGEEVSVGPGKHLEAKACRTLAAGPECSLTVPETARLHVSGQIHAEFHLPALPARSAAALREGLGAAVDIGTTTVVVMLADLSDGRILGRAAEFNQQLHMGDNVATRIAFCVDPENIIRLQNLVIEETILPMIGKLCRKNSQSPEKIRRIIFSGNTVMSHLALGLSPVSIGRIPFEPLKKIFEPVSAVSIGLTGCSSATVYTVPAVSGYVGGDIVSDIFVSGLWKRPGLNLLVDIGTNGEIVLADNGRMLATATAAGPAFEGAGMAHGMRAAPGAIEHIAFRNGTPEFSVIGKAKPKGLCGSAIVDFIAAGYEAGLINSMGRMAASAFEIVPAAESGRDGAVTVTEADIAELLKAKAAVYAGIKTLLDQTGRTRGELDRIILAGGFAAHLNLKNAVLLGLLPDVPLEKYEIAGNGSLAGAYAALLDDALLEQMIALSENPQVFNLAETKEFESNFIDALAIPNLNEEEFTSCRK